MVFGCNRNGTDSRLTQANKPAKHNSEIKSKMKYSHPTQPKQLTPSHKGELLFLFLNVENISCNASIGAVKEFIHCFLAGAARGGGVPTSPSPHIRITAPRFVGLTVERGSKAW
jgi:hypothetical protein